MEENKKVLNDSKFGEYDGRYHMMRVAFCAKRVAYSSEGEDLKKDYYYTPEYHEKYRNSLSDEDKKIFDTYRILYLITHFPDSNNSKNKPKLYVNKNCHSCTILGHQNLFELYKLYNVVQIEDNDNVPRLEDGDNKYIGIDLMRKLYQNININDIEDDKLEKMIENDHRNCTHE
jgi:hypothetical protein